MVLALKTRKRPFFRQLKWIRYCWPWHQLFALAVGIRHYVMLMAWFRTGDWGPEVTLGIGVGFSKVCRIRMRTLAKEIAKWNNAMSGMLTIAWFLGSGCQSRCLYWDWQHQSRLAMETILKSTLPTFSGHFLRLGVAEGALPSKGKTGNPAQYLFSIMND